VRAVVLAGGEGTRLRPLTFTTPKPLLPVANQAFLERQLSWLAAHGVDDVALSLGYLPDAFVSRFPDGHYHDDAGREVGLTYVYEPVPLGTAGAIRFAAERLAVEERFVVCNGDVLTGLDLGALVAFHDGHGAEATIALAQVDDPSGFGVVPTFPDGEVKAFVEKPPPGSAPTDWINAGTYVVEPSVLERIPTGLNVSIERETFPRMLQKRRRLYGMTSDEYWIDIGTPDQYLAANADVLAGRMGPQPTADARQLAPGVWVQGSRTGDGLLRSPVLLGDGCDVAAGATVSGSVLGSGVRVSAGARVTGSVVHEGAVIEDDAQVINSIVGLDALVGAGAILRDRSIVGAGATVAPRAVIEHGRIPAATVDRGSR
jgi:mannose-1-phosphate guanylyltransferase